MNRIVIIGNGFDLAHNLPTKYEHFIKWYWKDWGVKLLHGMNRTESDGLCTFEINSGIDVSNWAYVFGWYYQRNNPFKPWNPNDVVNIAKNDRKLCKYTTSPFLERISYSIETKGWVDIENEYYELLKNCVHTNTQLVPVETLNEQLCYLKDKLVEYLNSLDITDKLLRTDIRPKIYAPFEIPDISIEGRQALVNHIQSGMASAPGSLEAILSLYGNMYSYGRVKSYKEKYFGNIAFNDELPIELLLPNSIMILNFNYTHTADLYCKKGWIFSVNQIHGDLNNPKSVIFGYGDELDDDYKAIVNKNENKFLGNIKSIKYLESDKYRKLLSFIESEPYQVIIMGHSCGNSDRTLLNTLFEHKNCVSIKPYFYKWGEGDQDDNYIELVQNISRNFTDMKLMRDRVVNKTYCKPLT